MSAMPEEGFEQLHMSVSLDITYHVTVKVEGDARKTVDQLRSQALKRYEDALTEKWRNQFQSKTYFDASRSPTVVVSGVQITPRDYR